jgi:signal peptidase I
MAPTLMGRHKDFDCAQCGHHYTIGVSEEVHRDSGSLIARVKDSTCPNCRFVNDVYDRPVFNGDRILVNKFPYEFGEPDRFDVFVFRYPEDPQTNYIKRLVGLPGESLKIEGGDLYARKGSQGEYQILRKTDPYKQRLLQQIVYDDTQPPKALLQHGWPERWAGMTINAGDSGPEWTLAESAWNHDAKHRSFAATAGADWKWLRYRHLNPTPSNWNRALEGVSPGQTPEPELISDFCGYNSQQFMNQSREQPNLMWVGDLTIDARIDVRKLSGESPAVLLELVEGVRRYRCEFDLKSGEVRLLRSDELKADGSLVTLATAQVGIRGTGRHDVCFANVDDRLCVWIDNRLVPFGAEGEYTPPAISRPQQSDLHPVGVAVREVDAVVSNLVVYRDIYYRAVNRFSEGEGDRDDLSRRLLGERLAAVLSDPAKYREIYDKKDRFVTFEPLDDDEYFAMGDNSTHSYDGRSWNETSQAKHAHAVNRRALIGKAFFIYWPHGVPFLNDGKGLSVRKHTVQKEARVENYPQYTAPFYPQWWRWSRIR